MTFGFATGEFELTEDRYRPEEHIGNPKVHPESL